MNRFSIASSPALTRRGWSPWPLLATLVAIVVSACKTAPPPPPIQAPIPPIAAPVVSAPPVAAEPPPAPVNQSIASTPRAYRQSGANHIYSLNAERVYKGRLPPMLYAIGVLNIEIDREGHVQRLDWMRAPKHAPEVVREIERTVREASPFPAPARMGKVVYTDTWLWHKSGKFQLDTLTEGQN
jgi:protein TonB